MAKSLRHAGLGLAKDSFAEVLSEANDMFANTYQTNIIGDDFKNIVTSNTLFDTYKNQLLQNFDENLTEEISTLLDNTRLEILSESSMTGIRPFSSLTMPILVKLWARLSMVNALPTEPLKTPSITVRFMKPYLLDADGEKVYLPEGINATPELNVTLTKVPEAVALVAGKVGEYNLFTGLTTLKGTETLDRKFYITEVTFSDAAAPVALNGQRIVMGTNGEIYGEISYTTNDVTPVAATDTLVGRVDLEKHTITVASIGGKATAIKVLGFVSSEAHSNTTEVQFELTGKDVNVGTGQHIETSLPIELVTDLNAMYDIDAASVATDTMSSISAQKVDTDIIEFLGRAYASTEATYNRTFNVYPNSNYAMHPNEWMTGLRKTIDYVATMMKNDFKCYDAYFVIVGNPLDVDLLPNVDWTFQHGNDTVGGIDVTYSLGAIHGSTHYRIIASDLIPQGRLTIFAVPTRDDYKTFVYYPYSFNMMTNYLNQRNPALPSLALTRRYTMEEFSPIIGAITIENNDGTLYSRA